MKVKGLLFLLCLALFATMFLTSCGKKSENTLKDGYYSAKMEEFSHGWKEFVTICVQNGKIVTVDYNAENQSGFIKSWDMSYMRNMNRIAGTYPNYYTRTYAANLLEDQSADSIDVISGATHSYSSFALLAKAVIEQAAVGDMDVVIVSSEE